MQRCSDKYSFPLVLRVPLEVPVKNMVSSKFSPKTQNLHCMKEGQEAGQGYPALTQESLSKFSASLKKLLLCFFPLYNLHGRRG